MGLVVFQKNNVISVSGMTFPADSSIIAANPSGNIVVIKDKASGYVHTYGDYDLYEDASGNPFGANPGQVVTALNAILEAANPDGVIKSTDKITALSEVQSFTTSDDGNILVVSGTADGGLNHKPLSELLSTLNNNALTSITFDLANPDTLADGVFAYDSDRETLVFQSEHGELAIGEGYKPVYNNTGSTIAKGSAVKATGVSGEKFLIELFDASSGVDEELYFIGVTQADILDQTAGIVVSEGYVKHLDTSGYSVGNILYASETAGALTTTAPTSPNLAIPVAMVTKVDASNGTIYVRPKIYAHLNELHDVTITSPSTGQVLAYNTNVWENSNIGDLVDTDDISEGSTNLYYTDTRVQTYLSSENISASYPTTTITGNTTLTGSHEQKLLICDTGVGFTLQIPTGLSKDAEILVYQANIGGITISAGSGVTLRNTSGFDNITAEQYAIVGLKKLGASEVWVITGERKLA